MDKEPQAKTEPSKCLSFTSPTTSTTTSTIGTTSTTSTANSNSTVNLSQEANGTTKQTTSSLTAVTTFHNQPPHVDRKVVQVNLFGDRLAPAFSAAISSSQQAQKTVSVPSMPGSQALVRASSTPVSANRKISPQTLLVGKNPTTQTQMLLRAQMLQSLTLRPPPPGTLTIPPNLPLKSTSPCQPPTLTRARVPTLTPRPSPPPSSPNTEVPSKTEGTVSPSTPTQPSSTPPKAPPVRHLTVPPPSLYAPTQSHALAKQKLSSSSLKRTHCQISIPQHTFSSRQTYPNSSPVIPKKPLPELKRCPSTQPSQSGSTHTSSMPITVPTLNRSHRTPSTLSLPLTPTSPGGPLLATKQLLRIALSSASAQCANGQSKMSTISPPHELVHSKPPISPTPVQSQQASNPCQQLVHLSPSRQAWTSPQRASSPSPVLPLISTSSTSSSVSPQSPLASLTHSNDTSKESKQTIKQYDGAEKELQDLKDSQVKSVETNPVQILQGTANDPSSSRAVDTSMVRMVCKKTVAGTQGPKVPHKVQPASSAEREDMSAHSENQSAINSLPSDLSPVQSSTTQPSDISRNDSDSPTKVHIVSDKQLTPQRYSSHSGPAEMAKPIILTHLVDGFIIQEGLEPFPVNKSSLMVGPHCGSGLNGASGSDALNANSDSPDDASDSDNDSTIRKNGVGGEHRLVLQCHFCKRKGTAQTFSHSKRFCSKSCSKRFSYTKRFRELRRCISEGGHRSEFNGAEDELEEESFQQVKHGPTEQWRILQRPPDEAGDAAGSPMKTRLRRHTEQSGHEREVRAREMVGGNDSAPMLSMDLGLPTDLSLHSKPVHWSVDQVWSFISNLPGCQDIAESFRAQEIDGQALLLLTEDHLMSAMNVKLGPALKICARINSLKEAGR